MIKRLTDLTLAILGLVLTAPLLLLAAALVRFTSRGPVFFRQRRIGRKSQPFEVLKFRTMVRDAPVIGGSLTVAGDRRITRVGGWLRMSKIDELPQLINVLRGEMSVVGPRPEVAEYVDAFPTQYARILTVRPGLTDLASIRYRSEEQVLAAAEDPAREYIETILPLKLRLAEEYIQRASFLFDMGIVIRTIAQIFLRAGTVDVRPSSDATGSSRLNLHFHRIRMVTAQLLAVTATNYLAFQIRFDGRVPAENMVSMWQVLPWLIAVRGITFLPFRLYHGIWRYAGVYDLLGVVGATIVSSAIVMLLTQFVWGASLYPKSVVVIDGILVMSLLSALRLVPRLIDEIMRIPSPTQRVLIYGAGDVGERLAREIRQNQNGGYRAVGFIDDNPQKRGRHIHGVPVLGDRTQLPDILPRVQPDAILMAMPNADPSAIRAIVRLAEGFGVPVRTKDGDAAEGRAKLDLEAALRRLEGHRAIVHDAANHRLSQILRDSTLLVAGAGGVVGSELCRQLARFRPSTIVAIDRNHGSLEALANQFESERRNVKFVPVIADLGNRSAVEAVMDRFYPAIVFFSAGYGQRIRAEVEAAELFLTNVQVAAEFFRVSRLHGVDRLVYVSCADAGEEGSIAGVAARIREQLALQFLDPAGMQGAQVVRLPDALDTERLMTASVFRQMLSGGPVVVPQGGREFGGLVTPLVQRITAILASGERGISAVLPAPVSPASVFRDALSGGHASLPGAIRVEAGDEFAGRMRSIFHPSESISQTGVDNVVKVHSPFAEMTEGLIATRLLAGGEVCLADLHAAASHSATPGPAEPIEARAELAELSEFRGPCPKCGHLRLRRSRARGWIEQLRRRRSEYRPYVCEECDWRGWLNPGLLAVFQAQK